MSEPDERSLRSTRRSATVTISAPEASMARSVSATSLYLPVPTIRRLSKLRPAMTSGSCMAGECTARTRGRPTAAPASVQPEPLARVRRARSRRARASPRRVASHPGPRGRAGGTGATSRTWSTWSPAASRRAAATTSGAPVAAASAAGARSAEPAAPGTRRSSDACAATRGPGRSSSPPPRRGAGPRGRAPWRPASASAHARRARVDCQKRSSQRTLRCLVTTRSSTSRAIAHAARSQLPVCDAAMTTPRPPRQRVPPAQRATPRRCARARAPRRPRARQPEQLDAPSARATAYIARASPARPRRCRPRASPARRAPRRMRSTLPAEPPDSAPRTERRHGSARRAPRAPGAASLSDLSRSRRAGRPCPRALALERHGEDVAPGDGEELALGLRA